MKIKDLIDKLSAAIEELKEIDPELPASFIGEYSHHCCGHGGPEDRCYQNNEESDIYYLSIRKDNRKNPKTKKIETVGIVLVAN